MLLDDQVSSYVALAPRQVDMLVDAAEGLTIQESAQKRYLSPATVHQYRINVCHKLGAKNLVQAVVLWLTMGPAPSAREKPTPAPRQRWTPRPSTEKKESPWRCSMLLPDQIRQERPNPLAPTHEDGWRL